MSTKKMWLRDLLPPKTPFQQSRIMTFGYNSTLVNRKSTARIRHWADELLKQACSVRTTPEERSRPIIFVCHSLGGLVGREAMIRLDRFTKQYKTLALRQCGLLFFSTPHMGTVQADWNAVLLSFAQMTIGIRSRDIIVHLQSFNSLAVDSMDAFSAMDRLPPFYCLVEGNKTKVAGTYRTVSL